MLGLNARWAPNEAAIIVEPSGVLAEPWFRTAPLLFSVAGFFEICGLGGVWSLFEPV